jgi:general secretion pathway protein M
MQLAQLWQRLSVRERTLAGVAVGVLLLVIVRYGVIGPYLAYSARLEEEIEQEVQRVTKMQRLSSRGPQASERLNVLRQQYQQVRQKLIPGETPSVAAAHLQEQVRTLAAQSGLDLVTTQVMRDEAVGEFRKAALQVTLRGELPAVANFLAGVEYGEWRLAVTNLEVRSTYSPRVAQRRGMSNRLLTITLEVSGIMQGPENSTAVTQEG